jgi:lysophospholipase L1-like esterase
MNKVDVRAPSGFLALGDSYTIGEGVEHSQRWPMQLVARLRSEGYKIEAPEIIATTGWTTDELQHAINAHVFSPPYALVSLLIGVNNQYRGRNLDNYADEFSSLLDFAVEMAGRDPSKLLVVSIPDWGVTRFAAEHCVDIGKIATQIDQFNLIARSHAEACGAHWIDVTGISRGQPSSWLAQDGLHPSSEQYANWVEAMVPHARLALDLPAQGRA